MWGIMNLIFSGIMCLTYVIGMTILIVYLAKHWRD